MDNTTPIHQSINNHLLVFDPNFGGGGQKPATSTSQTGTDPNKRVNDDNTQQQTEIPPIINKFGGKTVGEIVNSVTLSIFGIIVLVAIIMIVVSGFRMLTGAGNESQYTHAKKTLTWSIVGLLVALMSFAIVQITLNILHK